MYDDSQSLISVGACDVGGGARAADRDNFAARLRCSLLARATIVKDERQRLADDLAHLRLVATAGRALRS